MRRLLAFAIAIGMFVPAAAGAQPGNMFSVGTAKAARGQKAFGA
jgi:hypothetical protein